MTDPRPGVAMARRGQVLGVPRGTTLGRPTALAASDSNAAEVSKPYNPPDRRPGFALVLGLMLVLPMFAQCFQYMTDIPPLYLLSKVWPVLTLPAAVWALMRLDIPDKILHLTLLFWMLAVTPMIGVMQLGNTFADAMATTVKIWSFSYVFAAAGILAILRAPPDLVRRVVIGLGIGTFVLMTALWVLVPTRWYGGGDLDTKLFMIDVERGYRIYMPMFFGVMVIFYLNRSAWIRFVWWKPLGVITMMCLMVAIYKQRAAIASVVLALVLGSVLSMRRWRATAFAFLIFAASVGGAEILLHQQAASQIQSDLGNSLAVRQRSVATAWFYLSSEPERWIFGVGGTTRLGDVTVGKLFNNPMFFLADIGWLGVLFEYGAIGVSMMLLVYCSGLRSAVRWSRRDDALSLAFVDYIIYLLAASVVYSAVFTPGELTTTMALSYFLSRGSAPSRPDQGIESRQPGSASPRQIALARSVPVGRPGWLPSGRASNG